MLRALAAGRGGRRRMTTMQISTSDAPRTHIRRARVIPTLLIDGRGRLVKTVKFGARTYIGDPINAVRIFNTKEVDELVIIDIDATREKRPPNYAALADIAGEAFMPLGYGGGIRSLDDVAQLYRCGIEKVVLSSALADGSALIAGVAARYGAQAAVVCLPVKKKLLGGYRVVIADGKSALGEAPEAAAVAAAAAGAGEIIVYAIDRDGTFTGYDLDLLKRVAQSVDVPVVACGGARNLDDLRAALVEGGCATVAAGSMFVYQSQQRGVLISYPPQTELVEKVYKKLA